MDGPVLQVNKRYYPAVGGVETAVRGLAEGLTARAHDVRVLVGRRRGFGTRERVGGVAVHRCPTIGVARSVPLAPTFPLAYRRAAADAALVHHHVPNPLGPGSDRLVRPDVPTVVTYHSDVIRQSTAMRVYAPVLRRFLADVDRIVVTSPRLRDRSPYLRPVRGNCEVIPLAVDPAAVRPGSDDSESAAAVTPAVDDRLPTDEPYVLCVGRLNYYKGVEWLVRAMASLEAAAPLVAVGDGPRRARLERLAADLGIDDRVRFLGRVDDRTLRKAYANAAVFVLPSVEPSEAFGIVQLEAMANGVPVVNTDLPTGVPWVSVDGETGLTVPPRDAGALARAVDRLLADGPLRERLGRAARRRVERRFTRERMLDRYEAVYRDVAPGKG